MLKDFGLKFDEIKDDLAYLFGLNSPLPKEVLNPDGNWEKYLPTYEPQFNDKYDTCGCTVFGTLNIYETMLKRLLGTEYNFSERFNYILADITPPGTDPHKVCEIIRKKGVVEEKDLPMTTSFTEYLKPKPMTQDLLDKANSFPYQLKHEYLWNEVIPKDKMRTLIEENLKYSPLGISVTAWIEKDGVYVDNGHPNTHWCALHGISDKGYLIFDSYDQSKKVLSFDHKIQICKRYYIQLKPSLPETSWWGKVIRDDLLKTNISLLTNLIKNLTDKMNKVNASELLYGTAKSLLGKNLTPEWQPGACASSLTYINNKAFNENFNFIKVEQWLEHMKLSPKWEQIQEVEPKCVICAYGGKLNHIAVVGKFLSKDGSYYTISNESGKRKMTTYLTVKDFDTYFRKQYGCKITYWRRLSA